MIAVIGTGRSGTNFFAAVLSELGKDVQHEKFGTDGITSWCLVADCDKAVYGPGGNMITSEFTIGHQLRDPLKTIGSLTTFNKASWRYIASNSSFEMPRKIMHRSMRHWLDWNVRAGERADYTWWLESLKEEPPSVLEALDWGVSTDEWRSAYTRARHHGENTSSNRSSKSIFNFQVGPITQWRRYRYTNRSNPVSWDELRGIDTGLADEIFQYASSMNPPHSLTS